MLKAPEISSIERELKQLISNNNVQQTHSNVSTTNTTIGSSNSSSGVIHKSSAKKSTIECFLEALADPTDGDTRSRKAIATSTSSVTEELRHYKLLAARYILDSDGDSLSFWKTNRNLLPVLSTLAKRYLASPATSVASEATFSVSANYSRKQRARLLPENLALSDYLHDKFDRN